jgi:hypothetical protein
LARAGGKALRHEIDEPAGPTGRRPITQVKDMRALADLAPAPTTP